MRCRLDAFAEPQASTPHAWALIREGRFGVAGIEPGDGRARLSGA